MKTVIEFLPGLNMGGAETLVKEYVRLIDKTKFYVCVLIANNKNGSVYEHILEDLENVQLISISDVLDNYKINRIPFIGKLVNYIYRPIVVKKIIRRISPDVIHVHLELLRYLNFLRNSNVNMFYTVHSDAKAVFLDYDFYSDKDFDIKKKVKRFRKRIMHIKERVAANSLLKSKRLTFIALHEEMRDEVDRIFNVNNTIILKNGIDFEKFKKRTEINFQKRDEIGIGKDKFLIGNVGWLHADKNPLFVLKIASRLVMMGIDVHVLLVGSGDLKQIIISTACDLSIEDRLTILSNRLDVPELLSTLNVFVFPSLYEGLPLSLVEAQAVGVKCVVADQITSEVCVSDQFFKVSLDAPIENWCDVILDNKGRNTKYYDINDFNMRNIVKNLEQLYRGDDKDINV